MRRTDAFVVEGEVVEAVSERSAWVVLPNGHRLMAFRTARQAAAAGGGMPQPGARVRVQVSPFDMSKGKLVLDEN